MVPGTGRDRGLPGRGAFPAGALLAGAFSAEARLIHAGTERSGDAPVTPPLVPASIYVSQGPPRQERSYGRQGNPGWEALEQALGVLEDADAVAFASGQAASMALMLTLAESRERIVLPADGYYGARVLADKLRPHGAVPVHVDQQDLAAVERELKAAPSVLWAETPTNPLLRVADLAGLAEAAVAAQAPMVVDNTTATGLLQRPLDWGAAASLYSLTKAISGHSDVIAGAVVSRDAYLLARLRAWRTSGGGIPGPFEAWLALRGLKTLPLRIARQSESALAIARHLAAHPRVRAVHYPGLEPSTLEAAQRQMPGRIRPAAVVRAGVGPGRRPGGGQFPADRPRHQLRWRGVDLGTPRPVGGRGRAGRPDQAVGRRGARRRPDHRHRPGPGGGAVMRRTEGHYELDDDPDRVDAEEAVAFLTTQAYWARWRGAGDIKRQFAAAWRLVGAYDRTGAMVGFARAFGDGGSAYLADVYVLPEHRGAGLGTAVVRMMIEDGPGAGWRWMLHTSDAHGLYRQFGFARPSGRYLERPARDEAVTPEQTTVVAGPLIGKAVRLEPLGYQHVPGLVAAARRRRRAVPLVPGPAGRGSRSVSTSRRRSRPGTARRQCRSP